jgi:hypothetical protein
MMPDQAPKCLCGTKQWNPGGASFSPGLQSQWFTCSDCGRPAIDIGNGGGHAFIISTADNGEFPQDGLNWLNSTLLLVWRDVQERLTTARNVIEQEACDTFCKGEGLAQGTKIDGMDEAQTERFRSMWDTLYMDDRWRKPAGFESQGLPPMVPQCVTVFHPLGDGEWLMIDHTKTVDITVPADPIRVRHDTYFNEVFAKLEDELGKIERTEVKNEYCGAENEPWYQFSIGKVVFTVGPRKRVIAVKITAPEGINTDAIRSVAQADQTTYTADGGWQSDAIIATAIEVHAWTKEKLVEYLTILGRENATA